MNAFVNAVKNPSSTASPGVTGNGAPSLATTGNAVLDFFAAAGNRNVDLTREFEAARALDVKLAYRVALWTRDIRGGAGERQTFRTLLSYLEKNYPEDLIKLLPKVPELGRWDDLLIFTNTRVNACAYGLIADALNAGNGLCAKWMPRKGRIATALSIALGLGTQPFPKQVETSKGVARGPSKKYRKLLSRLTQVVETAMCAKNWNEINFDHVPSVASSRYQKAFGKNAPEQYTEYKKGLTVVKEDGTTERKINASAIFPYQILRNLLGNGDAAVATAQWNALPNFLGNANDKILPMVDVSESMSNWNYYGLQNKKGKIEVPSFRPLDVAVSIGLYCADKQEGDFGGMFLTFTDQPTLTLLKGADIQTKAREVYGCRKGYGTSVTKAFQEVLRVAKAGRVSASDMPKTLLILSDMEFDTCCGDVSLTAFQKARKDFEQAGYQLPKVVFWNINGRADNNPVSQHESGTALVSGFSTGIFKSLLKADLETYSPYNVMLETINSERYDVEGLTV
jgi:hypothetical protein